MEQTGKSVTVTSAADRAMLDEGSYAIVQQLKAEYENAKKRQKAAQAAGDTAGAEAAGREMESAHAEAEKVRAEAGYSGGADGSAYLPLGSKKENLTRQADAWMRQAQEQSDRRIDYGVEQGVRELERALEDAQPEFKAQAEAVALDEAQGVDNAALYAELRGDRGGIGQSRHNEIRAAAARNRLAVQQAQTALGTETARQIADLRAQGEFEKASAALELTQQYLARLSELEKWSAELELDEREFAAEVEQWKAEYELEREELYADTELAYAKLTGTAPNGGGMTLEAKKQLASLGQALLKAGMMPSDAQLAAMGITAEQAKAYLSASERAAEEGSDGSKAALSGLAGKNVSVR